MFSYLLNMYSKPIYSMLHIVCYIILYGKSFKRLFFTSRPSLLRNIDRLRHGQLRSEEPNQRRQAADVGRGHGGAAQRGVLPARHRGVDPASWKAVKGFVGRFAGVFLLDLFVKNWIKT